MNLRNYAYYDLNIAEVENVVDILHDKTDDYLGMLFDDEWCGTAEDTRSIMVEYMRAVRNQTNILSMINSRLKETNELCNSLSDVNRDKISREMVKRRYA